MRRSLWTLVAVLALVASACGSATETVESAAPVVEDAAPAESDAEAEAVAETTTSTTTTTEAPPPPPPGREVLAQVEAEGTPHVLWFWGAN